MDYYPSLIEAIRILNARMFTTDCSFALNRVLHAKMYLDKQASEIAEKMCVPAHSATTGDFAHSATTGEFMEVPE